ncbi:lipopolysaccharide heptosyltransferase I [Pararobbsia alpina]|uniref:Lipopolysaccharide heptosyltransferase 1 n=1 Tax=Pararobbsia alpina TaxID=621374 RepID=A0A6S7CJ49_9BURK|nr:lipopolysaccharide heptosyltransferase I [Pararobbsia alpina]CAB3791019.1 Lipopolysaccharide heptosyltransferase 1 [Pararobbsia alpina]
MKRILIVKVTALGDIIQAQPLVADLHRAFPGVEVDWAADELFADVARWNPGISRVLSAPLKQFKRARSIDDLRAIFASIGEVRRERYDVVCDLHGVYKSAIISFIARSKVRFGYQNPDLGELGAAFAYTKRFMRRPNLGTTQGMRVTLANALGYEIDDTPFYGLRIPGGDTFELPDERPLAMLFHATSKEAKKWAHDDWAATARHLVKRGFNVALPWGSAGEQTAAHAIADDALGATVLPRLSVLEVARHIERAALVVGTDTGFTHLAHAFDRPTVLILSATTRESIGIDTPGRAVTVGDAGRPPALREVLDAIEVVTSPPGSSLSPRTASAMFAGV